MMISRALCVLSVISMLIKAHAQGSTLLDLCVVDHSGVMLYPEPSRLFPNQIYSQIHVDFMATSAFEPSILDVTGYFVKFDVESHEHYFYFRSSTFEYPNFAAFGDFCGAKELAAGRYNVTATLCYPDRENIERNGACFDGIPNTKEYLLTDGFGIRDFVLIDGDTDTFVDYGFACRPVCRGNTQSFNIRADTFGNVASVKLTIEGPISYTRVENVAPYALFGDSSGDFDGLKMNPGMYTISAQAFQMPQAQGEGSPILSYDFIMD